MIQPDGKAIAYINELPLIATMRPKRSLKKGELVSKDDVADILKLEFEGVDIPKNVGLVVILSSRWRKAVYYDFAPIDKVNPKVRSCESKVLLAQILAALTFQERFKISDSHWAELFRQEWFPFIGLRADQIRSVLTQIELGEPIDPLLDGFLEVTKILSSRLRELIATREDLNAHVLTLNRALEHFNAGDYVSCTSVLFPRIEGVMRSWKESTDPGEANQKSLAFAAIADPEKNRHSLSLLLPRRFGEFLDKVYFANFNPKNVEHVSRNSVSHGVAPEEKFSLKSAMLGVLILDQLVRLMTPSEESIGSD